jgi:hypothetical protein
MGNLPVINRNHQKSVIYWVTPLRNSNNIPPLLQLHDFIVVDTGEWARWHVCLGPS